MAAISVSKITAFRQCKYKYRLSYIEKVEQERFDFFKKGSNVHKAFETFTIADKETDGVVSKFFSSEVGKKNLQTILNAEKEVKVGLKIVNGDIVPCEFKDPDAFFHGIIDVLNGNNILDYKTGKKKSFEDQDWTQLMYYAAWLFLKHPEFSEVNIAYLYVEHNHENALTIKREYLNEILKKILVNAIEITKYEGNPTEEHCCSWACEYCGVRNSCKFYKEYQDSKLENIPFETIDID